MIETPDHAGDGPPSPCTKVCSIDRRTGWCLGCYRSGEEIGAWPSMRPQDKHALLALLPARRQTAATAGKR
jgi:predicted Fe-S protein YdhL (DUF1289 family)